MPTLSSGAPCSVVFSSSWNHRRISTVLFLPNMHLHMIVLADEYKVDGLQCDTYKRTSAYSENRIETGSGIGIEIYIVELGWDVVSIA